MLLESLVKATMELQGFRVMAVTGDAGGLVAELVPDLRFAPRCGQCGAPGRYRDTRGTRRFRHVPLWGIAVALRYAPRRVRCARCAGVHVESLPWVSGKQQMTRALMVVLATWARTLPWQQVARLFRCSWGTVATAVEEAVAYGLAQQDLADLTHIGIDEISRKRGHVYVTNVYDLARKRLVWSGPGRTQDTLHAFFDFLGPERTAALEGICCDMWQPYIDVIHVRAGQAVLVFDKLAISEFPKWRKYLISLSFRGQSSVRPVQVGGFDVNIVIHRSTAVRGRGGPARHDAWPPSLGAILAHTDGPCGS